MGFFFNRQVWGRALLVAAAGLLAVGCGGDDGGGDNGVSNGTPSGHIHDWGEWEVTTPATCAAAGVETRTCRLDASHKETQSIPKLTGAACSPGGGGSLETVSLGGLRWMKKNLNVETADSWCYNNSPDSCAKYGRLYTWSAAKAACQLVGMRLPTNAEWDALVTAASDDFTVGLKLKSKSGWLEFEFYDVSDPMNPTFITVSGNGTDDFGFSALPGGRRYSGGAFYSAGDDGYWWTATEFSGGDAYYRFMGYNGDYVGESNDYKSYGFSARCVQD